MCLQQCSERDDAAVDRKNQISKGQMMRIFVWMLVSSILLGCSENRKECLLKGCGRVLSVSGTRLGNCWTYDYDARNVKSQVQNYIGRTPVNEICMPFLCYAALKFEPERFPNNGKDEKEKFLFQWGGAIEAQDISSGYAVAPAYCFTVFMLTTNDVIRVFSFDLQRNRYNMIGFGSDYRDYVQGLTWLSIWDGHLNNLNKPQEMFTEIYKDVFAVMSERPFNYDCSPWATDFKIARDIASKKHLFRMVWQTRQCMLFLPEVLFDTSSF